MSVVDITSSMTELENIKKEIKIRSKELKLLKDRQKKLEDKIKKFMVDNNQNGVKYQGIAAILEEKKKRIPKKKTQKIEDCISVLKAYNVNQPEKLLKDIMETIKGDEVEVETLKIQNIRNIGGNNTVPLKKK